MLTGASYDTNPFPRTSDLACTALPLPPRQLPSFTATPGTLAYRGHRIVAITPGTEEPLRAPPVTRRRVS